MINLKQCIPWICYCCAEKTPKRNMFTTMSRIQLCSWYFTNLSCKKSNNIAMYHHKGCYGCIIQSKVKCVSVYYGIACSVMFNLYWIYRKQIEIDA